MEKYYDIKKYPKSKNNMQCLSSCYFPGIKIIHPINMERVTNYDNPFCATDEWEHTDPQTDKKHEMITDVCFNPTESENVSGKDMDINILTPYIDFNYKHFLKIYYNIFSFEDGIDWISKNKNVCLTTKMRIINLILKAYGENVELFDNRFVDFFIEFIKTRKIKEIYTEVYMYIEYDKSNKTIKLAITNLDKHAMCSERINYIIKMFLTKDEITKFLIKYFNYRKLKWNEIIDHLEFMSSNLTDYILNKISITLKT